MSKTYKKASFCDNCNGGAKLAKRMANKKVRREFDVPDGYAYLKKIYDSWDIHDYRYTTYSKEEVIEKIEDSVKWAEGIKSSYFLQGAINVYRRDPTIYKSKLFTRETIRRME